MVVRRVVFCSDAVCVADFRVLVGVTVTYSVVVEYRVVVDVLSLVVLVSSADENAV